MQNTDKSAVITMPKKDYSQLTYPKVNENFKCAKFTPEHRALFELASKTPTELWKMYPKSVRYSDQIIVPISEAVTNPKACFNQLEAFIKVPAKKPPLLITICNGILDTLTELMTQDEIASLTMVPYMNSTKNYVIQTHAEYLKAVAQRKSEKSA